MDLAFQVPMQYCSLQHRTLLVSPVTSTAGYCFCFGSIPPFFLELFLHWSPVAYWAPTDLRSSSFSILSFCLLARILKWFAIPFSSGPHSVRPLHHDPPVLGCPVGWLSFIELDKAVVLVWLYWLVFCEYGFSVSALWCPLVTPTILLGFLLPWAWGISSRLPQQSAPAAPYLNKGYLLTAALPDLQHGIAPLGPHVPVQPPLLGHEVAPPGRRPWPRTWGSSSQPRFMRWSQLPNFRVTA